MSNIILINDQTWIICGGRNFSDRAMFDSAMNDLIRLKGCPARIIHGDARGADNMADDWASHKAIDAIRSPAAWHRHGNAAGPIRNQEMLDKFKPQLVVAFPGGKGTADMVSRARAANVDVVEIEELEREGR